MPLYLLLILVVGGIAGIALALHLLGLSRGAPLDSSRVQAEWARHFPEVALHGAQISADGRAALLDTAQGPAILWQFGADTVARPLQGHSVTWTERGLRLRFADYTAPGLSLRLDPSERAAWQDLLRGD